ncbi:glycosyltransferase family 39 protein [Candidatus Daviesbacteria bacterium]|nr:glycosyltransferase family 39 protein [Candidatus Daviesbacteria bacterium]
MFKLALLSALYSYLIFLLGLLHLLKKDIISISTISFLLILTLNFRKRLKDLLHFKIYIRKNQPSSILLISLIIIQTLINLIGALGPELAFDALWYHLTIPKIYLQQNSIFYIGGHLYYSAMPKFTEMFYIAALALGSEITAKIIHLLFGIATLVALYKISRSFLSSKDSLLVSLIFYSNLVVGWMSITAYIDLARTFFETLALWSFLNFIRYRLSKWLTISATMLGFAASCKLLSLWSVAIYLTLLLYISLLKKVKLVTVLKQSLFFCTIVFIIVSPWLIFSYLNTGNPFYPIFSPINQNLGEATSFNPTDIISTTWSIFLLSPDPLSPIYFISLPLIIFYFGNILFQTINKQTRLLINLLLIYLALGSILLYFTPLASSGRFVMPYLPAFSLLFVLLLNLLKSKLLYKFLLAVVLIVSLSSIVYRGTANKRFVPVFLGKENVDTFMSNNLEYNVGNFYDVDNFFTRTIKPDNKVLIYGISNLYYVNFPYIHESWIKKGDKFDYILTKGISLPEKFKDWILVYNNDLTRVKLYSLNGKKVEY